MNAETSKNDGTSCDAPAFLPRRRGRPRQPRRELTLIDIAGRLLIDYNVSPERTALVLLSAGHTPIEIADALYGIIPHAAPAKIASYLPRECLHQNGSIPQKRNKPGTHILVIMPSNEELERWGTLC